MNLCEPMPFRSCHCHGIRSGHREYIDGPCELGSASPRALDSQTPDRRVQGFLVRERNAVPALTDLGSVVVPGCSSLIFLYSPSLSSERGWCWPVSDSPASSWGSFSPCFSQSQLWMILVQKEQSLPPGKAAAGGSDRCRQRSPLGR